MWKIRFASYQVGYFGTEQQQIQEHIFSLLSLFPLRSARRGGGSDWDCYAPTCVEIGNHKCWAAGSNNLHLQMILLTFQMLSCNAVIEYQWQRHPWKVNLRSKESEDDASTESQQTFGSAPKTQIRERR